MKKVEEVLDSLYNFTESQKNIIDRLSNELINLKDKKIGLETLNTLTNVLKEVDSLRENTMLRLIASMKRGDLIN